MNALVVLNVGRKSLHPKSKESFLAAASRWGVEFVEITEPLAPVHHFWQKAFAITATSRFDRVIQMDADMLIRWDAPSPLELVPEDHIGVVSARQFVPKGRDADGAEGGFWISRHRDACIQSWAARMGMEPCRDDKHLNGGLFIYSTSRHKELFATLRGVGEKAGWTKWRLPEQAALSVLLHNLKVPQTWLPQTWNIVAAQQCHLRQEFATGWMNGYVYHFTGKAKRARRIERTQWRKSPCDEIAQRLPGGGTWAEIGVADGHNAEGVLFRRPDSKAILVDRWSVATEGYKKSGDAAARLKKDQWEKVYQRAVRVAERHGAEVIRSDSESAAALVPNKSLDLVYIDAEHTEAAVRRDIIAWLPKVKMGGWIGGHDYNHLMERKKRLWGVKAAVDGFFGTAVERGVEGTWFFRLAPKSA
jgi:hypothetical protein